MVSASRIAIRQACAADVDAIAELAKLLGPRSSRDIISDHLGAFEKDPSHYVLVAEDCDGEIVGWLHVFERRVLTSGCVAEIAGIVVSPMHRRCGIGSDLIRAADEWATRRDCGVLITRSDARNQATQVFYPQAGLDAVKPQVVYLKPLPKSGGAAKRI